MNQSALVTAYSCIHIALLMGTSAFNESFSRLNLKFCFFIYCLIIPNPKRGPRDPFLRQITTVLESVKVRTFCRYLTLANLVSVIVTAEVIMHRLRCATKHRANVFFFMLICTSTSWAPTCVLRCCWVRFHVRYRRLGWIKYVGLKPIV